MLTLCLIWDLSVELFYFDAEMKTQHLQETLYVSFLLHLPSAYGGRRSLKRFLLCWMGIPARG